MRVKRISSFIPRTSRTMGFSIGGWDPFGGSLVDVLTGGTVNGQSVFSGGLPGLAEHLDEVAQGINVTLLGGTVGGALNGLMVALDQPVIDAAEWANQHKAIVLAVVAIVGSIFLGPLVYAAWAEMVGSAAVDATIAGVDAYDAAMIATDAEAIASGAEAAAAVDTSFDVAMIAVDAPALSSADLTVLGVSDIPVAAVDTSIDVSAATADTSYDDAMIATDATPTSAGASLPDASYDQAMMDQGSGMEAGTGGGTGTSTIGTSSTGAPSLGNAVATAVGKAVAGAVTGQIIGAVEHAVGIGTQAPPAYVAPAPAPATSSKTVLIGLAAAALVLYVMGESK